MREPELTYSDTLRFYNNVIVDDGCHVWKGSRHVQGYGLLRVGNEIMRANRIAFYIYNGYWAVDDVCHTCNNPPCVRKDHLYDGTRSENQRDRTIANPLGYITKLSIEDVQHIRLYAKIGYNTNKLMRMYGLSRNAINDIIARRSFKNVN